tara:strand:+ start:17077 stop:17430 length:354 start_codon:yes stop_codon:yes gene_type:complete
MSEPQSSRRKFVKLLGLSAAASMVAPNALANFNENSEILKLNPEQQEFMIRYGKWMDKFIEVIRIKKKSPDNHKNNEKMIALTEKVQKMKPELTEFLKDETFSMIYMASIKRVRDEI